MSTVVFNIFDSQNRCGLPQQSRYPMGEEMYYHVEWTVSQPMQVLYNRIYSTCPIARERRIDLLTIYGDELVIHFINELTSYGTYIEAQSSLRRIASTCLRPPGQHEVLLALQVNRVATLRRNGANPSSLRRFVLPTTVALAMRDRHGGFMRITP